MRIWLREQASGSVFVLGRFPLLQKARIFEYEYRPLAKKRSSCPTYRLMPFLKCIPSLARMDMARAQNLLAVSIFLINV